jgi:hypothetical protein
VWRYEMKSIYFPALLPGGLYYSSMGICARREEFFWAALKAMQLQRIQEVALCAEPSALDFSVQFWWRLGRAVL